MRYAIAYFRGSIECECEIWNWNGNLNQNLPWEAQRGKLLNASEVAAEHQTRHNRNWVQEQERERQAERVRWRTGRGQKAFRPHRVLWSGLCICIINSHTRRKAEAYQRLTEGGEGGQAGRSASGICDLCDVSLSLKCRLHYKYEIIRNGAQVLEDMRNGNWNSWSKCEAIK